MLKTIEKVSDKHKKVVEFSIDGSTPLGHFHIFPYKSMGQIWNVLIYKENRGKGFGRQMMRECIDFLKKEGYQTAWLNVYRSNTVAQNLYQSLGFKKVAETSNAFQMELPL